MFHSIKAHLVQVYKLTKKLVCLSLNPVQSISKSKLKKIIFFGQKFRFILPTDFLHVGPNLAKAFFSWLNSFLHLIKMSFSTHATKSYMCTLHNPERHLPPKSLQEQQKIIDEFSDVINNNGLI